MSAPTPPPRPGGTLSGLGVAPERLNPAAQRKWYECAELWGERLTSAHSEALALYCKAVARLEAYEAKIAADGEMVKANNGFPTMHPMRAAASQLERELHKQAMGFAALPARRQPPQQRGAGRRS